MRVPRVGTDGLELARAVDLIDPSQRGGDQVSVRIRHHEVEVVPVRPGGHDRRVAGRGDTRLAVTEVHRRHQQRADASGTPRGAMHGSPGRSLVLMHRPQQVSLGQARPRQRPVQLEQGMLEERCVRMSAEAGVLRCGDQVVIGLHHGEGAIRAGRACVEPVEHDGGKACVAGIDVPLEVTGHLGPSPGHHLVVVDPQRGAPGRLVVGDGMTLPGQIADVPAARRAPGALDGLLHEEQVARSCIVALPRGHACHACRWSDIMSRSIGSEHLGGLG